MPPQLKTITLKDPDGRAVVEMKDADGRVWYRLSRITEKTVQIERLDGNGLTLGVGLADTKKMIAILDKAIAEQSAELININFSAAIIA